MQQHTWSRSTLTLVWLALNTFVLLGCAPETAHPRIDSLVAALRATGASVRNADATDAMPTVPFTVPSYWLSINGDAIQVYLYEDATAAQQDAARVAADGFDLAPSAVSPDAPTTVDWVDTPHFFQQDQLIVVYAGENLRTLDHLETVLGPQFAGGESTAQPFGVDGQFDNGVRYRNLLIHFGDRFGSKGQLTFPATGQGPWPTVILFSGTGPADMDASYDPGNGQPTSTNFKRIAEDLGDAGIAVLRFNKRGVLGSGDYNVEQLQQTIVNQRIIDAEAVIATAKLQPEVEPTQLFLYGWSEGTLVVTHSAQKHPELAGLILQAPLNLSMAETLVYQQLNIGLPYLEEVIDQDRDGKLNETELATIPAGPVWFLGLFSMRTSFLAALLPVQPVLDLDNDGLVDIQTELRPFVEGVIPLLARFYAGVTPDQSISEIVPTLDMPILVLHGERDGWIPIRAAEEIAQTSPDRVTFIRYPNLGHALSPTDRLAEDSFFEMASEPIQDMIDWLLQHSSR